MGQLTRLAAVSELPQPGGAREFFLGQKPICVINTGGNFAAMINVCPHKGAPLSEGTIQDGILVCPWHGWEFRLPDGRCINHRFGASLRMFELVIHGEDVFLKS